MYGVDISPSAVDICNKIYNIDNLNFMLGDSENLPFEDNTFDAYLVSFGVRNFSDLKKSLQEAKRVLKPGGRFLDLEFSKVKNESLSKVYNLYSSLIPIFGKVIVGDEEPYKYLTRTIKEFPSQEEFLEIIKSSDFVSVDYRNIFNGVVAMHSAEKKEL
jgi:demethylmenaquinone methyltransferase/2-methoxy-6-polyprenyl-1,4-benzoquinol methylase